MKSKPYDIVIVPPSNIGNQAIDLSNLLSKWGTYFTLNESGPFPHISLYQAEFPVDKLEEVKSKLLSYTKHKKSFLIQPVAEVYKKEDGDFIEVQYQATNELYALHKEILELLNPLRNGLLRKRDQERYRELSKPLQENLDSWGYRLTGSAFRPHLTLTRLQNPDSMSPSNIAKKDFSFTVSQVGVFELGEHGTCIKKVAAFNLND